MDQETGQYIITYFHSLLTNEEKKALRHYQIMKELEHNSQREEWYRERGGLSTDEKVLSLLKDGYESFEIALARRIVKEQGEELFLNYCPICRMLARTPRARQCRYCKYNWHNTVVGRFEFLTSFRVTGRQFFMVGDLRKGDVSSLTGNYIDLTVFEIAFRPQIEVVEWALSDDRRKEYPSWDLRLNRKK